MRSDGKCFVPTDSGGDQGDCGRWGDSCQGETTGSERRVQRATRRLNRRPAHVFPRSPSSSTSTCVRSRAVRARFAALISISRARTCKQHLSLCDAEGTTRSPLASACGPLGCQVSYRHQKAMMLNRCSQVLGESSVRHQGPPRLPQRKTAARDHHEPRSTCLPRQRHLERS